MKNIAEEIRRLVNDAVGPMTGMSPEDVAFRESPDTWSKKEILGHLIDSAANNHQRIVRASCDSAADFPVYNQTEWVRVQQYHESSWEGLIQLWSAYNRHLCDLMERIPDHAKSAPCNIGREEPVTLAFLVKDYLRHLRLHMDDIMA